MSFEPHDLIDDRYRIVAQIGKGGHGNVYRAFDTKLSRVVAVKVLHARVAAKEEFRVRMQREATAMGQLTGTCAVAIYDFSETPDGELYIVMEYLQGRDLLDAVHALEEQGKQLTPSSVFQVLKPLVPTLEAAHARGIIHRDLKLQNVFVLEGGGPGSTRLVDFGLVKNHSWAKLTAAGQVAGSPGYIAPEAWSGRPEKIDHRIDVYSFGVMVFRLFAGRLPFDVGPTLAAFIVHVTKAPRPSLRALRSDLPPSIDDWTQKALAAKPADRFQSVQELWDDLELVLMQS